MNPAPAPSRYGPPQREELALVNFRAYRDQATFAGPLAAAKDKCLSQLAQITGCSATELGTLFNQAGTYLRNLLPVPFLEDRNGITFRRFPARWLRELEKYPMLLRVRAVQELLDTFQNTNWCQCRNYESPTLGDIVMCELQAGQNGAAPFKDYLVSRGRVEDLCCVMGILNQRSQDVRPQLEWRSGDCFIPSNVCPGDTATFTDLWGTTVRIIADAKHWVIEEVSGEYPSYYSQFCGEPMHICIGKFTLAQDLSIGKLSLQGVRVRPAVATDGTSVEQVEPEARAQNEYIVLVRSSLGPLDISNRIMLFGSIPFLVEISA